MGSASNLRDNRFQYLPCFGVQFFIPGELIYEIKVFFDLFYGILRGVTESQG